MHRLRRRTAPYKWSEARIERELRRLVAESGGRLPTTARLESLGLSGLREAISRRGIAYWAERLDVPLAPGQDRRPYDIADARADLSRVFAEHSQLPGTNRLREFGYPRLAGFIAKHGGVKRFCAKYRSELPPGS